MYKVQNATSGNIPLELEQGSITLTSGQTFDLDVHCSRKWMKTNAILIRLLSVGALHLVHDSLVSLPKAPIKKVKILNSAKPPTVAKKPVAKPIAVTIPKKPKVTDLSAKEAPTKQNYKKLEEKKEDPVEKMLAKKDEDPVEKMLAKKAKKKTDKSNRYSKKYDD